MFPSRITKSRVSPAKHNYFLVVNAIGRSVLINYIKGYFHLCPRMDFLQTLHINKSLYTNYENVFIELDS